MGGQTFPVAGALDDDLVAGVGQAVQGAVAQDGVVKEAEPFVHGPVAGDDETGGTVAIEDEQGRGTGRTHPREPEDKAQRNFNDAESRIMPGPGGRDFQQGYNCQAVVDHAHQVIVAAKATNQSSDKQQAVGMIEETVSNTGVMPRV